MSSPPSPSRSTTGVITAEIPAENPNGQQKVQLIPVAGTNGLYTLSSFLPPGFNAAGLLDSPNMQFPAEFLQSIQQSELLAATQASQDAVLAAAEVTRQAEEEAAAFPPDHSQPVVEEHPRKRPKKKDNADEDEVRKLNTNTVTISRFRLRKSC
jgi:hypothetical protein